MLEEWKNIYYFESSDWVFDICCVRCELTLVVGQVKAVDWEMATGDCSVDLAGHRLPSSGYCSNFS